MGERFWTTSEIATVKAHYPTGGAKAVKALLPHRTIGAIYQQAQKAVLQCKPDYTKRRVIETSPFIDEAILAAFSKPMKKGDVSKLADRLNRPRDWIGRRALALGMIKPRFKDTPWNDDEIEVLSETMHRSPEYVRRALAAKGFNRTVSAILVKRKRLGLKAIDSGVLTSGMISSLLGVNSSTAFRWIRMGYLPAKRKGTARDEGDPWIITTDGLRKMLRDHPHLVDLRKIPASNHCWFIDLCTGRVA